MKFFCDKCGWVLLDQQCNETKCYLIRDEMLQVIGIKPKDNKINVGTKKQQYLF